MPSSAYHMVGRALINHELVLWYSVYPTSALTALFISITPCGQLIRFLSPHCNSMREPHHKWLSKVVETNHIRRSAVTALAGRNSKWQTDDSHLRNPLSILIGRDMQACEEISVSFPVRREYGVDKGCVTMWSLGEYINKVEGGTNEGAGGMKQRCESATM